MTTTTSVSEQFGRLTVITWKDAEGISINVFTAGTRNSGLSATYPHDDRDGAKTWYHTIRDAALAGTPVWLIEAQVSALIDAVNATLADQELIDDINNTLDQAPTVQPVDVTDISGRGWHQMRQQARVTATRTQVHRKPLTAAEIHLIRSHRDGVVTTRPGQSWLMLRAIVRRGFADIHEVHGRHIIASVRLNARGMALVEAEQVAA